MSRRITGVPFASLPPLALHWIFLSIRIPGGAGASRNYPGYGIGAETELDDPVCNRCSHLDREGSLEERAVMEVAATAWHSATTLQVWREQWGASSWKPCCRWALLAVVLLVGLLQILLHLKRERPAYPGWSLQHATTSSHICDRRLCRLRSSDALHFADMFLLNLLAGAETP